MPRRDEERGRYQRNPDWEEQSHDWQSPSTSYWDRNQNRWSSRPRGGVGGYDRGEDDRWDYQGIYYNRGNFNPGWDREDDYGNGTGRLYDPWDRGWPGRDASLENFGYKSGYYQGNEQGWQSGDWWEDEDTSEDISDESWWVVSGPYSGVGPKNYQRSDERIREDINNRLYQHGRIDASDIKVEVKDGEVWLRGMVDSRRSKRLAEDIAEEVFGVKDIYNELHVHPENRGFQCSWRNQESKGGGRQTEDTGEEN